MRKLLRMKESEGQNKVSEKNLLTRGLVALTVVILCLAAMTLTAFAHYSLDIVSGSNKIKAAFFDVDVVIDNGNITVIPGANKTYSASLPAGTHSINVTHSPGSTANNGFVMLETTEGVYYTRQLTKSNHTAEFTFSINTNAETSVKFFACWGTSIHHNTQNEAYLTESNNTVNISIPGAPEEEGQEPDVPEATEPEETEPEVTEPTPTESEATQPEATEPTPTEPEVTEPEATEPAPTEPDVTEPAITEPAPAETEDVEITE